MATKPKAAEPAADTSPEPIPGPVTTVEDGVATTVFPDGTVMISGVGK